MKRGAGSWKQWGLRVFVGVLAVSLLLPLSSHAQAVTTTTVIRTPVDFVLADDPCLGEPVRLSGKVHELVHTTADAAGGIHLHTQFNPQGVRGVGLVSGVTYRGTGATNQSAYIRPPFPSVTTFVNTFNIVGRGPANNLLVHATTHVTINANGEVTATVVNMRIECR